MLENGNIVSMDSRDLVIKFTQRDAGGAFVWELTPGDSIFYNDALVQIVAIKAVPDEPHRLRRTER
jgi:hypothetical protein